MLENIVTGILVAAAAIMVGVMFYRTVTGKSGGRCGCFCSFEAACSTEDDRQDEKGEAEGE